MSPKSSRAVRAASTQPEGSTSILATPIASATVPPTASATDRPKVSSSVGSGASGSGASSEGVVSGGLVVTLVPLLLDVLCLDLLLEQDDAIHQRLRSGRAA